MSGPEFIGTMDEWMRAQEKRMTAVERRRRGVPTGGGGGGADVRVTDTPTIDLSITGNGSAATPYVISGNATALPPGVLTVTDTASVDLTLTGAGTAASPYNLSATVPTSGGGQPTLVRTNLAIKPIASSTGTTWIYQTGTTETVTATAVLTAGDGPQGRTGYIRRTITTAKTTGTSGPVYRDVAGVSPAGVAGDVWSGGMWVRTSVAVTITPSAAVRAGSTTITTKTGTPVAVPANTWTWLSVDGLVATGTYDAVQVWPQMLSSVVLPVGATIDCTNVLIVKDTTAGSYFDGSFAVAGLEYAWTGTANASTSTESLAAGTLRVTDTPTVDMTLTGAGTLASPYVVSAVATTPFAVTDTATIDMTLSGAGTAASPWNVKGDVLTVPVSLLRGPGTINPLLIPAIPLQVINTPTVELTMAGSGIVTDPFKLSAVAPASAITQVRVTDTATINMTASGDGSAATPWSIKGDVIGVAASAVTGPGTVDPTLLPAIPLTVTDTATVDFTLTGAGTSASPYNLSATAAVAPTPIAVSDSTTVDLLLTGAGTTASPWLIRASVLSVPATMLTGPGTIAPALVPATPLTIFDSPTIDLALTGSGTSADPHLLGGAIKAVPVSLLAGPGPIDPTLVTPTPLTVTDSTTVDLTLTGAGTAASPYNLSATAIGTAGAPISVQDTATLDLTLSGDGSAGAPYRLSGSVIAIPPGVVQGSDTATIHMMKTGAGSAGVPTLISGDVKAVPVSLLTGPGTIAPSLLPLSATAVSQVDLYATAGAATWTKPAGAMRVRVRVQGGGGAGGGVLGNATAGQGEGGAGASGSYAETWYDASALNATEAITVGAAGAAQTGGVGLAGGSSTFKGMTAPGGGGGAVMSAGTGTNAASGGTAAAATGGDLNVQGTAGSIGRTITGLAILQGNGGSSLLGLGGTSPGSAGNRAATGFGAGGSGAFATTVNGAGGAGSVGVVIVETWF